MKPDKREEVQKEIEAFILKHPPYTKEELLREATKDRNSAEILLGLGLITEKEFYATDTQRKEDPESHD